MTNCKIKLKGSPEEAKLLVIKNMVDLKKIYKTKQGNNYTLTYHTLKGKEKLFYINMWNET